MSHIHQKLLNQPRFRFREMHRMLVDATIKYDGVMSLFRLDLVDNIITTLKISPISLKKMRNGLNHFIIIMSVLSYRRPQTPHLPGSIAACCLPLSWK